MPDKSQRHQNVARPSWPPRALNVATFRCRCRGQESLSELWCARVRRLGAALTNSGLLRGRWRRHRGLLANKFAQSCKSFDWRWLPTAKCSFLFSFVSFCFIFDFVILLTCFPSRCPQSAVFGFQFSVFSFVFSVFCLAVAFCIPFQSLPLRKSFAAVRHDDVICKSLKTVATKSAVGKSKMTKVMPRQRLTIAIGLWERDYRGMWLVFVIDANLYLTFFFFAGEFQFEIKDKFA